ncbi:ABC-ATPase domain-containing protein [Kocuria marina]|uniref:ABC-ATPase domain-containing protein n=1 Tax=Kocuria marina TaxID=223184 RepID=UPI0022E63A70|nr:ABC-ATPase domain-containing protein [Kocuria marina]
MSSPRNDLSRALQRLDGNSYGAYKQLRDSWWLGDAELILDRVQSDPYAPPSLARLRIPLADTGIPRELLRTRDMRIAAGDFLTRRFGHAARELGPRGGKDTGGIFVQRAGQEILARSSVLLDDPSRGDVHAEIRCEIALPAAGRRIKGRAAQRLLTEVLSSVVERTLTFPAPDAAALELHVRTHLDAERLRSQLPDRGLVAFVADGAVLPRASGNRDEPLTRHAVPFETPPSLRVTLELSHGRTVSGMGIPEGVTVIVGGGYHGKSTLLQALERGVYNHVPGDGRELVITVGDAMSVRAEDGRAVTDTDVSPFITNLPTGADTRHFSTGNASGSTSQAASTVEAVEAGSRVLLLDEDTCATNLMGRDQRMRALVPGEREPITPFVDRVRALYAERGISTVLVTGGSGAFLDVADLVIGMDAYRASDLTEGAREVVGRFPRPEDVGPAESFGEVRSHVPRASSGSAAKPARARGLGTIQRGREDVDVSALSQLVDSSQTEAIARLLDGIDAAADGRSTLTELVDAALERIRRDGLDALSHHRGHPGHLALPRAQDVAAAYHRVRR